MKEEPLSRLDALEKGNKGYFLPLLNKEEQKLVEFFFDMGPSLPTAMGSGPLTHSEIFAWQSNTGVELQPWQCRLMRTLSLEYIHESHAAEDMNAPEPYMSLAIVEFDRLDVAKRLSSRLNTMMTQIKGRDGRNSSRAKC